MDEIKRRLGFEVREIGKTRYLVDKQGWPVKFASIDELAMWRLLEEMRQELEDCRASTGTPPRLPALVPVTGPGQVSEGDLLIMLVGSDRKLVHSKARNIIRPGTEDEEVVYNLAKNWYFITKIIGQQHHKAVYRVCLGDAATEPKGPPPCEKCGSPEPACQCIAAAADQEYFDVPGFLRRNSD